MKTKTHFLNEYVRSSFGILCLCIFSLLGTNAGAQTGINCASTALSQADEEILNFTFGSLNNSSDCNTTAGGLGSNAQRYSNYLYLSPPAVAKLIALTFSVQVGICGSNVYPNRLAIFIDYNHNGSVSDPGELAYSSPSPSSGPHTETGTILVPANAMAGITRLRVICSEQSSPIVNPCLIYSWGETEDYSINIIDPTVCNGAPSPGNTLSSSSSACLGTNVNLSIQNPPLVTGNTFQWYRNSGAIPGATNTTCTATITAADNFYCNVTCLSSGLSTPSSPIAISLTSFVDCYCNSSAASIGDEDIYQVTVNGASTNPLYANANGCSTQAPGQGSVLGSYSNFKPLGNLTTVIKGNSVAFEIRVNDCDGLPYYSSSVGMWIDYNHNGQFTDPGEAIYIQSVASSPIGFPPGGDMVVSGTFLVPMSALNGQTCVRVIVAEGLAGPSLTSCNMYGFGETEDYLINISPVITSSTLNLTCFIEGYWNGAGMQPVLSNQFVPSGINACDSIQIELRYPITFSLYANTKAVLQQNGTATVIFNPGILPGNYYIVVKNRTSIETWSALPVALGATGSYNFSDAASKAYGNNMQQVSSGVWAFYSGDVLKDFAESVDLLDLVVTETEINNFGSGYLPTDINGDGNVDILDTPLLENNISNFIFMNRP